MAQQEKSTGGRGITLGMTFGVAAGLLLGAATGDDGKWLAVGIGLGITLGAAADQHARRPDA